LILGLSIILAFALVLPAAAQPTVTVDGRPLQFGAPPLVEQGRTLVPLRAIFEALGASVTWDAAVQTVTGTKGAVTVRLTVGSTTAYVSGRAVALDVPGKIVGGRTLVPLRFVGESLGADVAHDGATGRIVIRSAGAASAPASADAGQGDAIEREYSWVFGGKPWNWRLHIPRETHEYYAGLPHPPKTDDMIYTTYVTDPVDDSFLASIAASLLEAARQEQYSPKQTVEFAAAFVQSLKYPHDEFAANIYKHRYPLETLVDQRGDCAEVSILLAAILQKMGVDVVLVILENPAGAHRPDDRHMGVGVRGEDWWPGKYYEYKNVRYYYLEATEATDTNWLVGDIPDEWRDWKVQLLPLVPQAVIAHEWISQSVPGGYIVKVTVHNHGTRAARETKVYAALDAGGGKAYDQQWSDPLNLEPRTRGIYTLRLKPPPTNVNTRLIIWIVSDGYLANESASEWFAT
jgi:hypothetical protein